MKSELSIPKEVEVKIDNDVVSASFRTNKLSRRFFHPGIEIKISDGKIILTAGRDSKIFRRMIGTFRSHIKNMMIGVKKGYTYKLKIVYKHFPVTLEKQDNWIIIKNFLGRKKDMKSRVYEGVKIDIEGANITLTGLDKEAVSQTAPNLEQTCRIRGVDRRVFQDGIYITQKDKGELDG